MTEQEAFAESDLIIQEVVESDGVILRRYKLRLVIDVAEKLLSEVETEIIAEEVVEEVESEVVEQEIVEEDGLIRVT